MPTKPDVLTLPYTLRMYDPERDYDTLARWWNAHGGLPAPTREMLPRLGVLAVPLNEPYPEAALFLFMDNSVGVCWIEYPVTRPAMPLKRTRAAFVAMITFLKNEAKAMGYGTMIANTTRGVARELKRFGFVEERRDIVQLICPT